MNIHEFRRMVDDIADSVPEYSDKEVTVMVVPNNGEVFGSISSTKVTGIIPGFDWDSILVDELMLYFNCWRHSVVCD